MRKKKLQIVISLTLLLSLALAGCGNKSNTTVAEADTKIAEPAQTERASQVVTVKHEWGEAEFTQPPQKIITLDFSFIDTLTALKVVPLGNAGVGKTKIPEYLDENTSIVDVGERKAPNLEVIQSLKPDLIIASVDRHSMIRKELEGIITTIALEDGSYDQVIQNVTTIGEIVNKKEEAKQVIQDLEDKIASLKSEIQGSPTILVSGYFDDSFSVWVKDSFMGTLMNRVGMNYEFNGEVTSTEGKGEVSRMALERVHDLNPDFLLLYGDSPDKLQNNPLFKDLKAVKEGHFLTVDRNLWSRGRGPIAATKILDELQEILKAKSASK
jgi:ABC-type Fe3+-citrate transport system substrate-binding protein